MALVLSICAFIFSLLALVAAGVTCVIVLGWKNSTHKVEYRPVPATTHEIDIPADVAAAMGEPEVADLQKAINRHVAAQVQADDADPFSGEAY